MDRLEWLECQPWLLAWEAQSPEVVDWLFHGFASFFVSALSRNRELDTEDAHADQAAGHLSEDVSHLFFPALSSPLDPAQMVLKLGVAPAETGENRRNVVLSFDGSQNYSLDIRQILSITQWVREEGCKICRVSNKFTKNATMGEFCTCQLLPPCLIIRLKQLNMIIYSKEQLFNEVMDLLTTLLQSENASSMNCDLTERKAVTCIESLPEASCLANASEALLQEFLIKIDCMSECAVKAVDVCAADVTWMSSVLHVMAQHATNGKNISVQLKALQHQLESRLELLEEDERKYIATVWGASSIQNPETRAIAVEALRATIEQKEQIWASILKIELVNASIEQ